MKRRQLFTDLLSTRDDKPVDSNNQENKITSLNKLSGNLDRKQALHLLRRATFRPNIANIELITGKSADDAANLVIGTGNETLPAYPTAEWATKAEEDPLKQIVDIKGQIENRLVSREGEFINWWISLIKQDSLPSMEKFTLFLSTVWAIEFTYDTLGLMPPPLLLKNNWSLRKNRIGNYKSIAEEMTLDGAMNLYQSLYYSSGKNPNENYMRELMELFTMGIGNYTEGDIKQGALVLTGWRTAPYFGEPGLKGNFNTYFSPNDHDIGSKTFMGNTIPARDVSSNTEDLVLDGEVRNILNILFTQRADPIAKFVSDKIFRYFVYSNIGGDDYGLVQELANVFKSSNFDLRATYQALFTSTEFFDIKHRGVQIKTPPELIISFQNQLNVDFPNTKNALIDLEQELYDPPNVGSWKGYRTWISTKTYPLRVKYCKDILSLATDNQLITLANQLDSSKTADKLILSLTEYFLPVTIDNERLDAYKQTLFTNSNSSDSSWNDTISNKPTDASKGIREVINSIIKAPDFQLC